MYILHMHTNILTNFIILCNKLAAIDDHEWLRDHREFSA